MHAISFMTNWDCLQEKAPDIRCRMLMILGCFMAGSGIIGKTDDFMNIAKYKDAVFQAQTWLYLSGGKDLPVDMAFDKMMSQTKQK